MSDQIKKLSIDDRLALTPRNVGRVSHIEVDQQKFKSSKEKAVLFLCPAKVYALNEETGECIINFENCLECGTCNVACSEYVKWKNPSGVFGVAYKYG